MKKSLSGTIDGVSSIDLLTVSAGTTLTEACAVLTNNGSAIANVEFVHVRSVPGDSGTSTEQETKLSETPLAASGNAAATKTVALEGVVFQAGDKIKVEVSYGIIADIDIDYLFSYTETVEARQMYPVLEVVVRKILEGLSGRQVCYLDTPLPPGPAIVPTAPGGAENANAVNLTSAVTLTSTTDWVEVLSVPITPSADDKDVRIWLTLLWEGEIEYRILRGATAITASLSVGDRESDTGVEPVVFPISNSPASAEEQAYKLEAKKIARDCEVSIGTTLYVEEIPG